MNKSYIEWLDYYENATKEDVIQDMMLDINSIKEQKQQIQELTNNWNELEEWIKNENNNHVPLDSYVDGTNLAYEEILNKMKEINGDKNENI